MTKVTCPVCKSLVERGAVLGEFQPVEYDERGLPWACSLREGFGLPICESIGIAVTLSGQPLRHTIAYDRRAGVVWTLKCDSKGTPLLAGDKGIQHYDRHEGEVAVDWMDRT